MRLHSLQVKLRKKIYARLKEELGEAESEIEVSYCEPGQVPLLGEDDETDEEIIDDFLNSLISSKPHEDETDEASDEESNDLSVTAGIGEHLNGVFMQVGEEMKHRIDALKNKAKIRPLTEEDVPYCEP